MQSLARQIERGAGFRTVVEVEDIGLQSIRNHAPLAASRNTWLRRAQSASQRLGATTVNRVESSAAAWSARTAAGKSCKDCRGVAGSPRTVRLKARAARRIMASAGESALIVQCPDQRFAERLQAAQRARRSGIPVTQCRCSTSAPPRTTADGPRHRCHAARRKK